ncbi:flagellar basal body-associated protein FliL, partial [Thermodesulfobacteriota bacterium]
MNKFKALFIVLFITALFGCGRSGQKINDVSAPTAVINDEKSKNTVFPLNYFIVNVNDTSGVMHYLKIEIKLAMESGEALKEAENKIPKIRDSIVTILTSKSVEDVDNTD